MIVRLKTNHGNIDVELDLSAAPATCENFLSYVKEGHYDNTQFHRVIPGFMIQGGGLDPDMIELKTRAAIKSEADNGLANNAGTIAMARTSDPHSATGQFFINVNDNSFLNHTSKTHSGWGYTVFGKVTAGMDAVMEISMVTTGNRGGHADVPMEAVLISKAHVID